LEIFFCFAATLGGVLKTLKPCSCVMNASSDTIRNQDLTVEPSTDVYFRLTIGSMAESLKAYEEGRLTYREALELSK